MITNRKGEVYKFIKTHKKTRRKDINVEFGYTGSTQSALYELVADGVVQMKKFDCGTCYYYEVVK